MSEITFFAATGAIDYLKPETNDRRYFVVKDCKSNANGPRRPPLSKLLRGLMDRLDSTAVPCSGGTL